MRSPQAINKINNTIPGKTTGKKTVVQPRLKMNAPDDRYEQEAEAMETQVKTQHAEGLIGRSLKATEPAIMRKTADTTGIPVPDAVASVLETEKGKGVSLPESTQQSMEETFGASFSSVRIHDDATAAVLSRQLGAKAFTHGSDIYFNQNYYDPYTAEGKGLLAHELTHVQQQSRGETAIQRDLLGDIGKTIVLGPLGAAFTPDIDILPQVTPRKKLHYIFTPYELKGSSVFQPNDDLTANIDEQLLTKSTASVLVKYGTVGAGIIEVTKDTAGNYNAVGQLIRFMHPAFDLVPTEAGMALWVEIENNVISGEVGLVRMPRQAFYAALGTLVGLPNLFQAEDMYYAILGEDYDLAELQVSQYENILTGGVLNVQFKGILTIGGDQKMQTAFSMVDESTTWSGQLILDVPGMAKASVDIKRDNEVNLFGLLPSIGLSGEWKINEKDFINGSLTANYNEGILDIRGETEFSFMNGRIRGNLGLLVTDEAVAWEEANRRLPERSIPDITDPSAFSQIKKLGIVGWGALDAVLIRDEDAKMDLLTAQAAFVLDPGGDVTVTGSITSPWIIQLFPQSISPWSEIIKKRKWSEWIGFGGWGIRPAIEGELLGRSLLGPVFLYDMTVSGVFSTRDDIPNSLQLMSSIDAMARLEATAIISGSVTGRVGTKYWLMGKDIATVSLTLKATAGINGFARGKPILEMKGNKTGKKTDWPQFFLKGNVDVGGEIDFDFDSILKLETIIGDWETDIHLGKRSIQGFAVRVDMNYQLGTMPTIGKKGGNNAFDLSFIRPTYSIGAIMTDLAKTKNEQTNAFNSAFRQKGKSVGSVGQLPLPPPPPDPVAEADIIDDFEMMGTIHTLTLHMGAQNSDATLVMESTPEFLLKKLDDEEAQAEKDAAQFVDDKEFHDLTIRKIGDLQSIRKSARKVIVTAVKLGMTTQDYGVKYIPGFTELGDMLSSYAEKYGVSDLNGSLVLNEDSAPGSKKNPFEIIWPKPATANYEPLYMGGQINKPKKQSVLQALYTKGQKDETGTKVEKYLPHQIKTLPGPGNNTIGISPEYSIYLHRVIGPLSTDKTPGGDKINNIVKKYGFYPVAEKADGDHVQEIQMGGKDVVPNLWPLDSVINQAAGGVLQKGEVAYPKTGKKVKIAALKGRVRKYWFEITGFNY